MSNWNEWSKHVLIELERMDKDIKELDERLDHVILDSTKTEAQKEADISQIRKDIDESKDEIRDIINKMESSDNSAKIASLQGELGVWAKIWMAILSIIVLGMFAYMCRSIFQNNVSNASSSTSIEKVIPSVSAKATAKK